MKFKFWYEYLLYFIFVTAALRGQTSYSFLFPTQTLEFAPSFKLSYLYCQ